MVAKQQRDGVGASRTAPAVLVIGRKLSLPCESSLRNLCEVVYRVLETSLNRDS